ncbi:DEAD/DEAH box helicase [Nocardia yamanashiensis]|uniref:DEAD/DEAH box helicase n=1 Tax=Nocardia yamanashiensis TaxID=209247 RepID=UPI001E5B9436|nr:DEAD/DEAH box helicase [Nocardia yamanashiensis]UGT39432.1 DEAD/DEAH box helicase [Nocardia yamanashiensis]
MLHGLWSPGSGLLLWRDPAAGAGAAATPGEPLTSADGVNLPDPLGGIVRAAKFRHKAEVLVNAMYGPERAKVPAHALAPEFAARVLLQALPSGAVAGDLRFLAHVARGVDRWVRAGRIVPEVRRDDGEWWARWRLVGGQRQRAWLAELAVAMPPALQVAGRPTELLENLIGELTDPIVRTHLGDDAATRHAGTPDAPSHPLLTALLTAEPLETGSHRVSAVLEDWRTSLTVDEPVLVLRLLEPEEDDTSGLWRLEVCLRTEGEAPQPVLLPGDPHLVRLAGEKLAAAKQAYPRLRDLPGDSRSMDLFMPTEVVMDLVAHGAPVLQAAGVRLLLPRAWRVAAPTMKLQVQSPPATESAVGLQGLVKFRWELALGDIVLTPAEMARLVQSKSDLVQLRGEWVQADHRMLAAAADYVSGRTDGTETTMGGLFAELARQPVIGVPVEEVSATGWAAQLFDADHAVEPVPEPIGLKAQLRPYQQRGLTWLATMSRLGCGAVLADDMGLGKTVQVLALLVHERETAAAVKDSTRTAAAPTPVTGLPGGAPPPGIALPEGVAPPVGAALSGDAAVLLPGAALSSGAALSVGGVQITEAGRPDADGLAVGPTLLVCPMSVVGNWQREAERFAPDLRVLVHHGAARRSGAELDAAVADSDLVITTYALLARDVEELKRQPWQRVTLDEAQHVKNAGTRQARAARLVPARHRLALTGTPVENRLEELRSILDFANPQLLGKPKDFHARFAVPIEREHDANAVTRLKAITSPFVLRRVKTDPAVISDLPDKIEMTVRANLTVEQAALYQAVLDDMSAKLKSAKGMERKGAVLAALTRLKQVCNHPAHYLSDGSALLRRGHHRSGKLALVEDILESVIADGERALLFTQFAEFGNLLAPYLTERFGAEVPFLNGGVSKQRRDAMVTGFQSENGPPLMLLSLKAGGTGLNLTAANHVVHLDRWWNPAVENQATDRAFRIGQRKDVQVRKLVCVDTIEERVDDMLRGKSKLADLTVSAGEKWITELGDDELRELFALGAEAVGE